MAISTTYIIATEDDGYITGTGNLTQGSVLPLGGTTNQWACFLFRGIAIPQGAVINSAYVNFYRNSGVVPTYVAFSAEKAANGTMPANGTILAAKTKTSEVNWTISAWNSGYNQSVDIKDVIQEVVNQAEWENGNDILVFVRSVDNDNTVYTYDYQSSNTYENYLEIDYTPVSGTTYYAEINENLGFRYASADMNMMEYLAQVVGLGASFDTNMREVESTLGLLDSFIASFQYYRELSLGIRFSATAIGSFQYDGDAEADFGLSVDIFASFQYTKEVDSSFSVSAIFDAEKFIVLNGDWSLQPIEISGFFSSSGGLSVTLPFLTMAGLFLGEPWSGAMSFEFPAMHATDYKGLFMAGRFGAVSSSSLLPLSMEGTLSSGRVISGNWILKELESAGYFGAFGTAIAEPLRCSGQLTVLNPTVGALSLMPLSCSGTLTAEPVPADLSGAWSLRGMVLAGTLQNTPFWSGAMQIRKLSFAGQLVTPDSWAVSCRLRALSLSGMLVTETGGVGTLILYPLELFGTLSVPIPKAGWYRISKYKSGIYGEYVENKVAFHVVIEAEVEHL